MFLLRIYVVRRLVHCCSLYIKYRIFSQLYGAKHMQCFALPYGAGPAPVPRPDVPIPSSNGHDVGKVKVK